MSPSRRRLLALIASAALSTPVLTAAVLTVAALAAPALAAHALADECGPDTLAAVAAKVDGGPSSLPSYSANVRIHARMHGFPFFGTTMSGTSTYEKPGNYALVLNDAPRFADEVRTIVHDLGSDITSSSTWNTYNATAACPAAGKLLVHLVPKTAGDTKAVDLTLDTATAHVVKATFSRSDGTITVDQQFGSFQGHDVILHQNLALAITRVKADVAVDYSDINLTELVAGR